ncbi:putative amidase domain protein [Clostridium homopropionicum DSM 5847]|uniref:Putative amidase domain protein n=1 Tax=Clostridium homopropionicum DSM 5847 TaxID=1121318 RepID=A0A0L6ZCA9_9CLOT|nr:amidase domain-containing protein [Clostridium homopropionicum]KOA20619.1 putative amidase domain protein [Clostridium homopropionicum DSM 5847]SFF92974.1 Putative amidase domain-containing protein [Clostridium homopropionicum]
MFIVIKRSKFIIFLSILLILAFLSFILFFKNTPVINLDNNQEEVRTKVEEIFRLRNLSILTNDEKAIGNIYDLKTKYGTWAYEHEIKKLKYLHNWSEKQGVKFISINPKIVIRSIKGGNGIYNINLMCSTEYVYVYENEKSEISQTEEINSFRIGTSHSLRLNNKDEKWFITKEWYTDPFADSLNLDNIKANDIKEYILSQTSRDFSNLNNRRISAVEYADQYCGTAAEEKYGYKYNKKYGDYNPLGGDCANFASQILFEGGKFKKTGAWNFNKTGGTKAWLNAQGFKDYMVGSGRASVIAKGNYNQVYKASYKLQPGDFVAYEKKGRITHISVVTGADSKGYSLVNCHNTDRYRVPWDLGWSDKNIKFWLVRVHY